MEEEFVEEVMVEEDEKKVEEKEEGEEVGVVGEVIEAVGSGVDGGAGGDAGGDSGGGGGDKLLFKVADTCQKELQEPAAPTAPAAGPLTVISLSLSRSLSVSSGSDQHRPPQSGPGGRVFGAGCHAVAAVP